MAEPVDSDRPTGRAADASDAADASHASHAGTASSSAAPLAEMTPDSPVVAVLVARDPSAAFEDTLASLAAQDHPAFSILVIDDGSIEPVTARVAAIVPSAFVRREEQPIGYGAAANLVRTMVSGAGFLLFCHDDVALAPDAARLLAAEAVRSGAAIVGPKLVAWTDHERLLAVGLGLDRAGNAVSVIERGERDQGQHDVATEAVAVPGATMLVRADAFAALEGFDPRATRPIAHDGARGSAERLLDRTSLGPDLGEDIDLCWRARISGYSIAIEPSARVAHFGSVHGGGDLRDAAGQPVSASPEPGVDLAGELAPPGAGEPEALVRDRLMRRIVLYRERNRIQSMIVTSSGVRLPLILPVLLLQTVWRMISPRHRAAGATRGRAVWRGAFEDIGALRARRATVQASRRIADRDDLRRLLPVGARARAALRADVSADTARLWNLAELTTASSERARRLRLLALLAGVVLWLIGSRGLIASSVTSVQQFAPVSSARELLKATAHTGAAGGRSAAAPALAFLGALTILLLGHRGFVGVVTSAGMLIVGALTIWKLVGYLLGPSLRAGVVRRDVDARSRRRTPQALVTAAYLAGGVGMQAIAAGRLDAAVTFGLFPLVVTRLLRTADRAREERPPADLPLLLAARRRVGPAVPLGVVLAVVLAFAPGSVVAYVVTVTALVASETDGPRRRELVGSAGRGLLVAVVLLLPWSVDLAFGGASWTQFTGGDVSRTMALRTSDLLRLSGGVSAPSMLTWGLLGAAAVAVLLASGAHLRIALRGWALALVSVLVVWLAGRGWLGALAPHPLVLLVPAGIGLAIAAGFGAAVFADDVRSQRFGWRQVLSVAGFVVFVVSLVPAVASAGSGRWGLPERSARDALSWLDSQRAEGGFRVVWIGSPRGLPIAGWSIDRDLSLGVSTDGLPQIGDQWLPRRNSAVDDVVDAISAARSGGTARVGVQLARESVRYIVVVDRSAPSRAAFGRTAGVAAAMVRQFDLRPIESEAGLFVYENAAWRPVAAGGLPVPGAPVGASVLRALQALAWLAAIVTLASRRRRRRSAEALLLEQERLIGDEDDDRIGDLFTTSFGGDTDEDTAFADFLERTERPEPNRRRRPVLVAATTAEVAAGAIAVRAASGATDESDATRDLVDRSARDTTRDITRDITRDTTRDLARDAELPEDGSLADELWSQWTQRQAERAGRASSGDARRGPAADDARAGDRDRGRRRDRPGRDASPRGDARKRTDTKDRP